MYTYIYLYVCMYVYICLYGSTELFKYLYIDRLIDICMLHMHVHIFACICSID